MESKFKNSFDNIKADEELKASVLKRVESDKNSNYSTNLNKNKPQKQKRFTKLKVLVAAALVFVIALPSFAFVSNAIYNPSYDFSKARAVKTEQKLSTVLNTPKRYGSFLSEVLSVDGSFGFNKVAGDAAPPMSPENEAINRDQDELASEPTSPAPNEDNYSQTNVQVDGMDEGDLVKNDGRYIYRFSPLGFSITEVNKGQMELVCQIDINNFNPIEMYISDKKLVLIGGGYTIMPYYDVDDLMGGGYMDCFYYHTNVEIRVFDLTDIKNPVEESYYQIEGNYNTSRLKEENNTLYFVVNYYTYTYYNNYDKDSTDVASVKRPYVKTDVGDEPEPFPIEDIYYFKNVPSNSYLILGAIDLNEPNKEADVKAYLSDSGIVYVSGDHLYMSVSQWFYSAFDGGLSSQKSYISKFKLTDLSFVNSNYVLGSPRDRHCLDEYNGYLRVATSYAENGWSDFANGIYVFDKNMKKVSSILGIAKGEQIDSATFSGNKGYISTSVRMVDPLFIIDFTDVKNPKISQGLKEDGINMYLKPIKDSDFVLGIGQDNYGLKIQLYDMSGEEAISVEKLTIEGNCSYAEALYNPKAILYMYDEDTKKGIIGFAAERSGIFTIQSGHNYNYYYTMLNQGFYLYEFDAENGTLGLKGLLSNFDTSNPLLDPLAPYDWETYQNTYLSYISRAVVIGDYIYTISPSTLTSYDLTTLTQHDKLS